MPRKPDERINKAKALYFSGMKLVEIASQLNLPEGTVRRWKSTHKWDIERSDKDKLSERSERKLNIIKEDFTKDVKQVIDNSCLTDKQRLFCIKYIRCFNATKAYQKAYGCSYEVANSEGYKLLVNPRVKSEIQRLKQNRFNREMVGETDIFQKYIDIAFADITDFAKISKDGVEVKPDIDGSLISEVSNTQAGVKIKLNDRMRALQWLSDHMDLATEKQKTEIAHMKAQTDKLTGDNVEIEDLEDIEGDIYGTVG